MDALAYMQQWINDEPLGDEEAAVVVSDGLVASAYDALEQREQGDPLPERMRLFADKVRLVGMVTFSDGTKSPMHLTCCLDAEWADNLIDEDHLIRVDVHFRQSGEQITIGAMGPTSSGVVLPRHVRRDDRDDNLATLVLVAHLLALINTPAFVSNDPPPRQTRRQIDRSSGGSPSERVRIVSWNLTKPRIEAGESEGSGRHMPLHYTRGHWRRCAEHLKRAQPQEDGVHRMWIEGFWSGHPAHGVVRAIHAPKT